MSSLCGPMMLGEARLQGGNDRRRVVDRQRGLGDEGELRGILRLKLLRLLDGLDQDHRAGRQLAERADDLRVTGVADHRDLAAALEMDFRLAVDLRHQRTGCVEREEIAALGFRRDRLRHAMRREHHRRVGIGNLVQLLDEDRALGAQALHHVAVVDDLVPDIDRRAIELQRPFHRVDGADHARAKAARGTKDDMELRLASRHG